MRVRERERLGASERESVRSRCSKRQRVLGTKFKRNGRLRLQRPTNGTF